MEAMPSLLWAAPLRRQLLVYWRNVCAVLKCSRMMTQADWGFALTSLPICFVSHDFGKYVLYIEYIIPLAIATAYSYHILSAIGVGRLDDQSRAHQAFLYCWLLVGFLYVVGLDISHSI